MFSDSFDHYLTYGATDQHTLVSLSDEFDGLVVPATIAAFQRDGTGGFVLTLSASITSPDYVIDSRLPLFQQALPDPKKSHLALAELLGKSGLVKSTDPSVEDFDSGTVDVIVRNWIDFNLGYTSVNAKFDKYAKRLDEPVDVVNSKEPKFVLAPYFVASGIDSPWWDLSSRLYEKTRELLGQRGECVRVVSLRSPESLEATLSSLDDNRVAIWISNLNEIGAQSDGLYQYALGIRSAAERGTSLFAMYGGFFSVALASIGLGGSCHGVGFGEHRNWVELPRSGPAPARYYVPQLHRYISQDDAHTLWRENPDLVGCNCVACEGQSPIALDYHDLMKHSVYCRSREIQEWSNLGPDGVLERMKEELAVYREGLDTVNLPERIREKYWRASEHLDRWISVFSRIT